MTLRLICILLSLISFQTLAASPVSIIEGSLAITESISPPDPGSPDWQQVTLPDQWSAERYQRGSSGWYRFELANGIQESLWAVYLPRLNMNAAVYFNGVQLGNGGSFDEPLARNWSRPLYFTIPPSLWRDDRNVLEIKLKSYFGYGLLDRFQIGPDELLKPLYEQQRFWQGNLARALFLILIAISIFMFNIWRQRKRDTVYFWFGLTTITWSLLALNIYIHELPLSAKWWDTLVYSAIAWWTVFLAIFSHRFANIQAKRFEVAFTLWACGSTIAYVMCDIESFPATTMIWQMGSPIIGFIVIVQLVYAWSRNKQRPVAGLALGIALIQLAGVYTYMAQTLIIPAQLKIFGNVIELASPILLVFIAWHLTGRFVRALNEAETLNLELEARVEAKSAELETTYKRLTELEKQQAVHEERERIRRDLHDDVGAKLLSLTYRSNDEAQADLARSALQDLRDVVTRTSKSKLTLSDALADWRAETSDRLDGAQIGLTWRQPDALPDHELAEQQVMNIGRVLREAISNAMQHGKAKEIHVAITHENDQIHVVIENDGQPLDPAKLGRGRGTQNMKTRAQALGGAIAWCHRDLDGCRVEWWFPLRAPL